MSSEAGEKGLTAAGFQQNKEHKTTSALAQ